MKLAATHSHRFGRQAVLSAGVLEEVESALHAPNLVLALNTGKKAKALILKRLFEAGWAPNPQVAANYDLDVNAMKSGICLTTQTGNIARAFYDLMKFEVLHKSGRADAAVLIVPSKSAAQVIASNVAQFERIRDELELFRHVITIPLLLLAFE